MIKRKKSIRKKRRESKQEDLYFTLAPGNLAFSWNYKDNLAILNFSSEKNRMRMLKTHKLRFKKDLINFQESFRRHHSLDDEILKLFTHELDGKIHKISNTQDKDDFLNFCIQERITLKQSGDSMALLNDEIQNKR